MKFEHIMLNEMSRASDRTLGKDSLNNLLHILADYMKSNEDPTWNRLSTFIKEYGLDWNTAAKQLDVSPTLEHAKSKANLKYLIQNVAEKNGIDLGKVNTAVEKNKDEADILIDTFWKYYEAKQTADQAEIDKVVTTPEFEELVNWVAGDIDINGETAEEAFGRHFEKVNRNLIPFTMGDKYEGSPEEAIEEFWNWHRAKKTGKDYSLSNDILERLADILESENADMIFGNPGIRFYVAKSVGKMLGRKILAPGEEPALTKELKRIMNALDNPEYIDQIEAKEKKQAGKLFYTASPGSSGRISNGSNDSIGFDDIPAATLRKIVNIAAEDGAVEKEKIGKLDKNQVKDCYRYCMNQLNRKFHVGQKGAFDGTLQEFYDNFKIIFTRGYTTKTLYKILDEVTTFLVDRLDAETAAYWKNREDVTVADDFNEACKLLNANGFNIIDECGTLYCYESDEQRDVCQKLYDLFDFDIEREKGIDAAYKEAVKEFKNLYPDVKDKLIPEDNMEFEKVFGRSITL